jgi:predicted nucleotidyltransferase component of viral defense system
MNQDYVDTVRLLLAVAPAVFRPLRFALKGGTALNLFVQDMPRLSVDIDVVFTDHTLDREAALKCHCSRPKKHQVRNFGDGSSSGFAYHEGRRRGQADH